MNAQTTARPPANDIQRTGAVRRRMIQVAITLMVLVASLFLSAGRLDWIWAWALLGASLLILLLNALIMPRDLIAERGRRYPDIKPWDRRITRLALLPTMAIPIVAGLGQRFGWEPALSPAAHLLGLALYLLGQGLFSWAMASNRYFSTAVRIQTDRGHQVATGGPYRYLRHPGYAGFIVAYTGMAVALGSLWAVLPAAILNSLMIIRTALEDRTLQQELSGYEAYARQVRYRLLPGIW